MKDITIKSKYVEPEINVIEIKSQGMMCTSFFDVNQQDYDYGNWTW